MLESLHHAPCKSCLYCYHHFHRINNCPFINHYVIDEDDASKFAHEHVQTTTILGSEEKVVDKVEEKKEQTEPPPTANLSNEKEVSIEAHSIITTPLETLYELQASVLQCLKELSHAKLHKNLCTHGHKSRNHVPKKILQSKQLGHLRRRNILPKGYQILKKKG